MAWYMGRTQEMLRKKCLMTSALLSSTVSVLTLATGSTEPPSTLTLSSDPGPQGPVPRLGYCGAACAGERVRATPLAARSQRSHRAREATL